MQLQQQINEYSSLATKLQLLPNGAKYSFGVDFSLRLNEAYLETVGTDVTQSLDVSLSSTFTATDVGGAASAATTAALLGADLKRVIKCQLRELRAKMQKQASEHSKTLLELAETLATVEETKVEVNTKIELVGGTYLHALWCTRCIGALDVTRWCGLCS